MKGIQQVNMDSVLMVTNHGSWLFSHFGSALFHHVLFIDAWFVLIPQLGHTQLPRITEHQASESAVMRKEENSFLCKSREASPQQSHSWNLARNSGEIHRSVKDSNPDSHNSDSQPMRRSLGTARCERREEFVHEVLTVPSKTKGAPWNVLNSTRHSRQQDQLSFP